MKGQKEYNLAQTVHERMYVESTIRDTEEQKALYDQYFELIKKAAYQGYLESMYDLGQQYEDMSYLGIPNPMFNAKKCVYWYTKACQQGHPEACNNLANFYELGEGCEQNLNVALELFKRSAELGSRLGKKNYKIMCRDMSNGGKYNK